MHTNIQYNNTLTNKARPTRQSKYNPTKTNTYVNPNPTNIFILHKVSNENTKPLNALNIQLTQNASLIQRHLYHYNLSTTNQTLLTNIPWRNTPTNNPTYPPTSNKTYHFRQRYPRRKYHLNKTNKRPRYPNNSRRPRQRHHRPLPQQQHSPIHHKSRTKTPRCPSNKIPSQPTTPTPRHPTSKNEATRYH